MGLRHRLESLAQRTTHPFLSREFDDKLSVLLVRSSSSLMWNCLALGALLSSVALFSLDTFREEAVTSPTKSALIAYAVVGVLWNTFSAMAHSAKSGRYGRGLLLFAVWPLSFAYNWRETLRQQRRHRRVDAA